MTTTHRPALARYLAWLDETADRLEKEATEAEALASARAISGGGHRQYLSTIDIVERQRRDAADYRRKALKLRIEENKRRRASA